MRENEEHLDAIFAGKASFTEEGLRDFFTPDDQRSLKQAIKEFNDWNGPALLYYNKEDQEYRTEVFANDVDKAQNLLTEGNFGIISKNERDNKLIGEVRTDYIIDFVELVKDGWAPHQAEYKLYEKYPSI